MQRAKECPKFMLSAPELRLTVGSIEVRQRLVDALSPLGIRQIEVPATPERYGARFTRREVRKGISLTSG
jgi:hypothetical protein